MATYTLSPSPYFQFLDDSGNPLALGTVSTFLAGTSTPVTTYQTSSGTAHATTITLDSAGRTTIYLQPGVSYKYIVKNAAGTTIRTQDNIAGAPASAVNVDIQEIAGENLAAGDVVYLSKGLGGLNAGQWYKADADNIYSSSDATTVGMAPDAIAQGDEGTIRLQGAVTVTGPLTPGADYYVSATAGGLTATAPAFTRRVGQAYSTTVIVLTPNPGVTGYDILQIEALLG